MNGLKKLASCFKGNNKAKNLALTIVILVEIFAIMTVASFAWVETVSSIKITNNDDEAIVDSYVFTTSMIGSKQGSIDLGKYFRQGGDMHLAPASSADGTNFYFPQKASANATSYTTNKFRKGNISDKNITYLSVSFRLQSDDNTDFFFTEEPVFSQFSDDIRVSVTAYSEGMQPTAEDTKIFGMTENLTGSVVNSSTGSTGPVKVNAFNKFTKKKSRIFSVGAEETKIVTVNLWLQKTTMNELMSATVGISKFGITSDLTPRHVTLIPTPTWDTSGTTEYFYAYCWGGGAQDRLYPITLDPESEHYTFDYNGKYDHTLFIRSGKSDLAQGTYGTDYLKDHWNDNTVWNKTEDTQIPNSPVDPTFVIKTINGSTLTGDAKYDDSNKNNSSDWDTNPNNRPRKSTGEWIEPVTVNVAHVSGQDDAWGSLNATTYIGTSTTTNVMEQTKSSSAKHVNTVHGWHQKRLKLSASANTAYAFVGWYSDPAGTSLLSTNAVNADYDFNITAQAAAEITYYAKFKEVRKITLSKYVDGSSSSKGGTIQIDSETAVTGSSTDKIVDKGSTVTLKATPATGYSFAGFYSVASNGTALSPVTTSGSTKSVTITANSANYNTTYYARFTTNTHTVYLNTIGSTGSTVQYGNETAATSVSKTGVKYNTPVTIKANPAAGYKFVGWYDNDAGTGTAASTNASYSFTLGDADVTYYAKFETLDIYLTGYLNGGDVTTTSTDRKFTFDSSTGKYTLSYKFTGNSEQFVTIYDGSKAYHPASANAGSGTAGTVYNSYIAGDDSTNPAPYYKWRVPACKGTTVSFTWDPGTKILSWSSTYRELYLKPNSNWTQSSARFAAYVYGNGNAWDSMTSAGSGYYKVTVSASYPNIIFARMNGGTSTNNWSNKWNQTGDLTIPADKNCFTVPDGDWDGSTTTWSLY